MSIGYQVHGKLISYQTTYLMFVTSYICYSIIKVSIHYVILSTQIWLIYYKSHNK
jgi:hypothetical protein